jgi:hypothetical protein
LIDGIRFREETYIRGRKAVCVCNDKICVPQHWGMYIGGRKVRL